tara:strand:+ start:95 stop:517 length:423 start_codon:yes stop_codon:yes gene_type:complete
MKTSLTRIIVLLAVSFAISSCVYQRAGIATKAKSQMIGMTEEQILACMGPPGRKAAAGETTVWSYSSGGDSNSTSSGNASVYNNNIFGSSSTNTTFRSCKINVVMKNNLVERIDYSGRTGGLFTKGEQCAFAVENCVKQP